MKNDAIRILEMIEAIDVLMCQHGTTEWEYGARFPRRKNDKMPSDADIREEIYRVLQRRNVMGAGRNPSIMHCCLYCEFGHFDAPTPNVFWGELWNYLAGHVDVTAIKQQLSDEKKQADSRCVPYGGDNFLKIVAEHLNPIPDEAEQRGNVDIKVPMATGAELREAGME